MKPVPLSRRSFLAASAAVCFGPKLPALPAPPTFSERNAEFAFDLFLRLHAEDGNLVISPFGISAALAMTAAGAKDMTFDEMQNVLRLPQDPHPAFGNLIARVTGDGAKRGYQLTAANALFGQTGYPWRPEFVELTRKNYGAGLVDTDFKADPDGSRRRINAWVEKETKTKIKDVIPAGVIKPLTRLVLANAVHFKGNWASQFKKELTKDAPFTRDDGKKAEVPLMNQVGDFGYAESVSMGCMSMSRVKVLELPYVGKELSMLIFLPDPASSRTGGFGQLQSAQSLANITKPIKTEKVNVHLPRFKMAWGTKSLVAPLELLGMQTVFSEVADLSGMHSGGEKLHVADVLHKASVDVNEEGTEAAAATAVVVDKAPSPPPPQPKEFRADRPFLFVIRENATGSVLFLGRYTGPT